MSISASRKAISISYSIYRKRVHPPGGLLLARSSPPISVIFPLTNGRALDSASPTSNAARVKQLLPAIYEFTTPYPASLCNISASFMCATHIKADAQFHVQQLNISPRTALICFRPHAMYMSGLIWLCMRLVRNECTRSCRDTANVCTASIWPQNRQSLCTDLHAAG
jgi:hypothetical protein